MYVTLHIIYINTCFGTGGGCWSHELSEFSFCAMASWTFEFETTVKKAPHVSFEHCTNADDARKECWVYLNYIFIQWNPGYDMIRRGELSGSNC